MAMDRLEEDGYIRKTQGRRAVVAAFTEKQRESFHRMFNCCKENSLTEIEGYRIRKNFQPCSDYVASEMGLEKGGFLVLSVDVDYCSEGQNIAHSVTIFDARYLEKFGINAGSRSQIQNFVTEGIYEHARRSHGEFFVSTSGATNQIPGLAPEEPVFVFWEVMRDESGNPLAYCKYHMSGRSASESKRSGR